MRQATAGSRDQSEYFYVVDDTTGLPVTGLVDTDVTNASYTRPRGAAVQITVSALGSATAAHSDGGFKEVSNTLAPGVYRLDVPDAAYASDAEEVTIALTMDTNYVARPIKVELESTGYIINDDFAAGAVDPSSRDAIPGPSSWTVVDVEDKLSISAGRLQVAEQASPVRGDQGFYGPALARTPGRIVTARINKIGANDGEILGWFKNAGLAASDLAEPAFWLHTGTPANLLAMLGGTGPIIGTASLSTDYDYAVVQLATGMAFLMRTPPATDWKFMWIHEVGTDATLRAGMTFYTNISTVDYCRVVDALWLPATVVSESSPSGNELTAAPADLIAEIEVTHATGGTGGLRYRVSGASDYWRVYADTDGSVKMDEVVSGTPNNHINVASVWSNATTRTVRVIADGDQHALYTLNGTTWTKRGSTITDSTYQTQTGVQSFTSGSTTVANLRAWNRTQTLPSGA